MKKLWLYLSGLLVAGSAVLAQIGELTVKVATRNPPAQLDESIRAIVGRKVIQVGIGDKPIYEFWLRPDLPLQSKPASPAKGLDTIKQATLLGVVNIPANLRDYRDDELPAGAYTMRFALQPQDGNHLGTSEFSYFAVLTPAKSDLTPDGIDTYKALVKASSKATATEHPIILSLRPAASDAGDLPKLNTPAPEHRSVRVRLPAKFGEDRTNLVFEIVFQGKAHK